MMQYEGGPDPTCTTSVELFQKQLPAHAALTLAEQYLVLSKFKFARPNLKAWSE